MLVGDLEHALSKTHPSSLRDKAVEIPDTTWADVGGLEKVKQELMETGSGCLHLLSICICSRFAFALLGQSTHT